MRPDERIGSHLFFFFSGKLFRGIRTFRLCSAFTDDLIVVDKTGLPDQEL